MNLTRYLLLWLAGCLIPAFAAERIDFGRYTLWVDQRPAWVKPTEYRDIPLQTAKPGESLRFALNDTQQKVDQNPLWLYRHVIRRVIDKGGLTDAGQWTVDFNPEYEKLILHRLDIVRNGTVLHKLDRTRFKLLQREQDLERQMYNGMVTATVTLDDLRVGDLVDIEYSFEGSNPVFGKTYGDNFPLAIQYGVDRLHLRILSESTRPLALRRWGEAPLPQQTSTQGYTEYTWQLQDTPPVRWEEESTPWNTPLPAVQLTEYHDWQSVARWADVLFQTTPGDRDALQAVVADIRQKTDIPQEQARLALKFVQDEIRYFGTEIGVNSHRPEAPAQVLKQRYGDCKDKTLLLVSLLRELGIDAQPALVATSLQRGLDEWLPNPALFNHVITRARIEGKTYWLDGTLLFQEGTLDSLGVESFQRALIVSPETTALIPMLVPSEVRPTVSVEETFTVRRAGDVTLDVVRRYRGSLADRSRARFAQQNHDDIARENLNRLSRLYPRIQSRAPISTEDDTRANEFVVTEHYTVPEFFKLEKQRWHGELYGYVIREASDLPQTLQRKQPLWLSYPLDIRQITRVIFPTDQRLAGVESFSSELGTTHIAYKDRLSYAKRVLTIGRQYRVDADSVPPEDMPKFIDTLKRIHEQLGFTLRLEQKRLPK